MQRSARSEIDDAAQRASDTGEKISSTLFGSLARSAASAAVSVTVTFATGWLLRRIFDRSSGRKDMR